jgi:hypothetical protein
VLHYPVLVCKTETTKPATIPGNRQNCSSSLTNNPAPFYDLLTSSDNNFAFYDIPIERIFENPIFITLAPVNSS